MVTFEVSLNALVAAGTITYEEAVARSLYPRDVQAPLATMGVRA
jgi:twitching motility protein PilT